MYLLCTGDRDVIDLPPVNVHLALKCSERNPLPKTPSQVLPVVSYYIRMIFRIIYN